MKVNGKDYRTVWMKDSSVFLIEQNLLPFEFNIYEAKNHLDTCKAIKTMIIRGVGAIGAAAGFATAQSFLEAPQQSLADYVEKAVQNIKSTRPTAQNLFYAVERVYNAAKNSKNPQQTAIEQARKIADEDAQACRKIGEYGSQLIKDGFNIETHCNAGWLAFVDYGTALSPIYNPHRNGKKVLF